MGPTLLLLLSLLTVHNCNAQLKAVPKELPSGKALVISGGYHAEYRPDYEGGTKPLFSTEPVQIMQGKKLMIRYIGSSTFGSTEKKRKLIFKGTKGNQLLFESQIYKRKANRYVAEGNDKKWTLEQFNKMIAKDDTTVKIWTASRYITIYHTTRAYKTQYPNSKMMSEYRKERAKRREQRRKQENNPIVQNLGNKQRAHTPIVGPIPVESNHNRPQSPRKGPPQRSIEIRKHENIPIVQNPGNKQQAHTPIVGTIPVESIHDRPQSPRNGPPVSPIAPMKGLHVTLEKIGKVGGRITISDGFHAKYLRNIGDAAEPLMSHEPIYIDTNRWTRHRAGSTLDTVLRVNGKMLAFVRFVGTAENGLVAFEEVQYNPDTKQLQIGRKLKSYSVEEFTLLMENEKTVIDTTNYDWKRKKCVRDGKEMPDVMWDPVFRSRDEYYEMFVGSATTQLKVQRRENSALVITGGFHAKHEKVGEREESMSAEPVVIGVYKSDGDNADYKLLRITYHVGKRYVLILSLIKIGGDGKLVFNQLESASPVDSRTGTLTEYHVVNTLTLTMDELKSLIERKHNVIEFTVFNGISHPTERNGKLMGDIYWDEIFHSKEEFMTPVRKSSISQPYRSPSFTVGTVRIEKEDETVTHSKLSKAETGNLEMTLTTAPGSLVISNGQQSVTLRFKDHPFLRLTYLEKSKRPGWLTKKLKVLKWHSLSVPGPSEIRLGFVEYYANALEGRYVEIKGPPVEWTWKELKEILQRPDTRIEYKMTDNINDANAPWNEIRRRSISIKDEPDARSMDGDMYGEDGDDDLYDIGFEEGYRAALRQRMMRRYRW